MALLYNSEWCVHLPLSLCYIKVYYRPAYLFCMFDFKIHAKKRHKCNKKKTGKNAKNRQKIHVQFQKLWIIFKKKCRKNDAKKGRGCYCKSKILIYTPEPVTPRPSTEHCGTNRPASSNSLSDSILECGKSGFIFGKVPSTRDQFPIDDSHPITESRITACSKNYSV